MVATIDLTDQVALVTGSSRGIGRAIAERLAGAGAHVILNGTRETAELTQLAADISAAHGVTCEAVAADIGVRDQVNNLFQATFKKFKRLDILVNNAGILKDGLIGMIGEDDITSQMQVNAIGTLNCIQSGARLMARSGGGTITNLTSIMGVRGNSGMLVYSASKGAVISATLSAAKELAEKNIRVNAIAPGFIATDMIDSMPAETHEKTLANIAMGRLGTPEDVADVALFLASPLSRYVTGTVIGVDGGMLV